jgi:hypothetical protein
VGVGREAEARRRLDEAAQIAAGYRKQPVGTFCEEAISRAEADWALSAGRPAQALALHRAWLDQAGGCKPLKSSEASEIMSTAFQFSLRYCLMRDAARAAGLDAEAADAESKRHEIIELWRTKLPTDPPVEFILSR